VHFKHNHNIGDLAFLGVVFCRDTAGLANQQQDQEGGKWNMVMSHDALWHFGLAIDDQNPGRPGPIFSSLDP
jgi:hypothetical protein